MLTILETINVRGWAPLIVTAMVVGTAACVWAQESRDNGRLDDLFKERAKQLVESRATWDFSEDVRRKQLIADGVSPDIAAQEAARWREREVEASGKLSEEYAEELRNQSTLDRELSATWWERILFDKVNFFFAYSLAWCLAAGAVCRVRRLFGLAPIGAFWYTLGFFIGTFGLIRESSTRWTGFAFLLVGLFALGIEILRRRKPNATSF